MPPITNQQRRDFTKKVDAFDKKLASLTEKDLERVTLKQVRSGNVNHSIVVSEEIENMVEAYNELFELDSTTFRKTGEHLNADRQLKAYYAACEKFGIRFWDRVQAAMPEDLVKSKIADSQNAINSDDPKKAAESVNEALHAVRKATNWESLTPEIENLYHAAENKFGYAVFNGTQLSFGHRLRGVGFNLQMGSFDKMLENYDPNVHTDLRPFAEKYEAASACAQGSFDKERCNKAFQAAVDKMGMQFCNHLSSIPQEFVDEEIDSFTRAVAVYDDSNNPEKAQNLTTKYLDTVKLVLKNDSVNRTTLIQNMYDAVKKKCGEAAADRIVEIEESSYKLSNMVDSINARKQAAEKNERKQQAEREDAAGFAWKGKWAKPVEIVNENFLDPKLVNWVLSTRSAADNKKQLILDSNEDRAFMNLMAESGNLLYDFAIGNHVRPIDNVVKNVYEDYTKAHEYFTEAISSGEVGSTLYKARLEAMTVCGAMGLMASRFISVAKANTLGFENVRDVDPMAPLRETLTVLRDEMERIPKSGNDTQLYTSLNNAINGVIDNAGISLEELHTAAEQYFNARKGSIFGPLTAAGKQRLDIANRVIGFLDVVHYKRLDALSKANENVQENVQENVEENAIPVVPAQSQETPGGDAINGNVVDEENLINNGSDEYVKIEENVEENLIDNGSKNAPAQENAKVEKQEEVKPNDVMSMDDKVYELIREKCKQLNEDGVVPKGSAGDIAIIAYNASYEQKEFLLNNILNNDNKVKALVTNYPESKDFRKALDTILDKVNNPVEQNEVGVVEKQVEHSIENQSEMERNEFNLLEPDDENEFHLLDPEDGPENNEMQQSGYGI